MLGKWLMNQQVALLLAHHGIDLCLTSIHVGPSISLSKEASSDTLSVSEGFDSFTFLFSRSPISVEHTCLGPLACLRCLESFDMDTWILRKPQGYSVIVSSLKNQGGNFDSSTA